MSSFSALVGRLRSAARAFAAWPSTASGRLLSLVLAFTVVNIVLLAPQWAAPGMVPTHRVSLEAGLLVMLFAALPRNRLTLAGALLSATAVVLIGLVGLGDATTRMSLSRPLNLYLDARLLSAVLHLLTGTLGAVTAWLAVTAAAVGTVALVAVLGHLLAPPKAVRPVIWSAKPAAFASLLLVALVAATRPSGPTGAVGLPGTRLVTEQARFLRGLVAEREMFALELSASRDSYEAVPRLLQGLGGRDVVLAFVESYGISALDDPRYAPVIEPRLEDMEDRLDEAGLELATGTLVAPSQGGQSWLGHGSILSGLWLHNQMRYDLLLGSDRQTLVDDFRAAGYRTAALMPAITMPWPEGTRFGYDEIYAFADIDYRGPPLNWVTMPDQFTWSFLEHQIRSSGDGRPVFAELGLISSHAPWTPILDVIDDWDTIGDGSVFEAWRDAGERPEDLWRDADRVREQYALSVDYALHAATAYAERYGGDDLLIVVLGDHQPAPLITGEAAPRTVPVHVIAKDPGLLKPFRDWGFAAGAFPDPEQEALRMDAFRPWFISTFSGSAVGSEAKPGA
jgi:hypothetical protein